jgi:hypothetical protein
MPVITLQSTDHVIPRSTLRHRPLSPDAVPDVVPCVARASRTRAKTHPPAIAADDALPAWKHRDGGGRTSSSSYHSRPPHRLGFVGIGMLIAVTLFLLGQGLVGWIAATWNDLYYGQPRTYQTDVVVGQNDSFAHPSHFIALNLAGQVEVIELPGGDATHAKIYLGPRLYGPGAALVPVTLQFVDRRHDHHPDMLVLFQGMQLVFHNTQGSFEPG